MRFRKKPVVIDAWQISYDSSTAPNWVMEAADQGRFRKTPSNDGICVATLEGEMFGLLGDWLIKGVKGEIYPCKADIFELTYEKVTEES